MIVQNPTDKDITVMLKGVTYTVKANDSLSGVPEKQALYWRGLHNFLTLGTEVERVKVDEPEEVVEEKIKEEAKEEVATSPEVKEEEVKDSEVKEEIVEKEEKVEETVKEEIKKEPSLKQNKKKVIKK